MNATDRMLDLLIETPRITGECRADHPKKHFGKSDLHHVAALVVEAGHRIELMSVREVVGLYAGLPDDTRAVSLDVFPETIHDLRVPQR